MDESIHMAEIWEECGLTKKEWETQVADARERFSQTYRNDEICVRLSLRDKKSTMVKLLLPGNSTARDAMAASGLIARDGTPYRCFDAEDNVIDEIELWDLCNNHQSFFNLSQSLLNFVDDMDMDVQDINFLNRVPVRDSPIFDIYLGVPKEIQAVMIEESTFRGLVGKGRLMDGTTVFVPQLKEGDFAWVVISGRHGRKGCRANGFTVRMEGEPYQRGDIITIKPSPHSKSGARIFNPKTCKWDLSLKIKMPPNVNREDYIGLMWTVRIDQTNPLVGTLDTNLTWRPKNQPEIARKARNKQRHKRRKGAGHA